MMRARPFSPLGRARDVTSYFLAHAAVALLFALPAVALVSGSGIGRFPDGDRLLFQPGGLVLADVARAVAPYVSSSGSAARASGALFFVLLLVPHAALLVSLSRSERERAAAVWGRAIGHFPRLLLLSGLALIAQVIVVFVALAAARTIRDSMSETTTRNADLAYLAVATVGLLLALVLGLVRDLGRAAVVLGSPSAKTAIRDGLMSFARAIRRTLLGWTAPAAAGVGLVLVGALVTEALDVSRPGTWRVGLVAVVHQAIAYALCWCRAFWLGRSLAIASVEVSGDRSSVP